MMLIRFIFSFVVLASASFAESAKLTLLTSFEDLSKPQAKKEYEAVVAEEKGSLLTVAMLKRGSADTLADFSLSTKEEAGSLGSNVLYLENKDSSYLKPIMRDVKGIIVGVFGLCSRFNDAGSQFYFLPPVETARKMVQVCKEKGADLIVLYCDLALPEIEKIAHEITGIDIIIGKNPSGQIAWFEEKTFIYLGGSKTSKIDLMLDMKHTWRGKHLSFYPTWREVSK
jgi:hypothetical protein